MIKFTVKGRGQFPLDMLRYDRCFPEDSQSAWNMDDSRVMRRVVLIKPEADNTFEGPTVERWSSFGWTVSSDVEVIG